ncbi:ATP-binding protein [Engelhardtia mirabilis]|uniref:Histidine kinase-, DNA gyrase B-, and HSP90-like ATPase n=1 Tax=Engelhardtia mirabilis TaxID=2528011 RepID=A0A518BHA4_9BACT|nr:Histidine kinase-, DNA gyrase B-, and HSP90-like ATPase [Planctomycetes bacterium Pla133]QDV00629.1 Histidine kinase-, DNA gyrase B-, and HSP90-like ATPase [Planctomycetes bacterium Pla86]
MRLPARADGPPRELVLELPATHGAVRQARAVVRSFARTDGVASDEVDRIALVLTELLGNAVDHGGGGAAMTTGDLDGDVRMRFRLELEAQGWILEVSDDGLGGVTPHPKAAPAAEFDPASLLEMSEEEVAAALEAKLHQAEEHLVPDVEDERGRGFFLVREMVDELEVVEREDAPGRTVRVARLYGVD